MFISEALKKFKKIKEFSIKGWVGGNGSFPLKTFISWKIPLFPSKPFLT